MTKAVTKAATKAKPKPKPGARSRPRMTPAEHAWASADTVLGIGSDEHRDVDGRRIYLERGREVAALALVGDELVTDFEPPREMARYARVMRHYRPCPDRPGWLRFRRPATRDPRPDLEADLGSMLGTAASERNPPARFRRLTTSGRYVCVELSRVPRWGGDVDAGEFPVEAAIYRRASAGADTASLLALDDRGWALVLGSAHPLVHLATSSGGVFARVVSHAGTDEALEAVLARAPVGGWQSIGEVEVREAVRVFDAATFGGAIGEGNSLALALSPGVHQVGYRTWRPDAGTELRLVRLHRA